MSLFNYLNYCTIYGSCGDVDVEFGTDCCFHLVTKDEGKCFMNNTYTIRFFQDSSYCSDFDNNNYCLLDKEHIERILNVIKGIHPFEYSLTEGWCLGDLPPAYCEQHDSWRHDDELVGDDRYCNVDEDDAREKYKFFQLDVTINGEMVYHKFILKIIRSFYEFPFNVAIYDVEKLRSMRRFRIFGTVNLFIMTSYLIGTGYAEANDDQSITKLWGSELPVFMNKDQLCENLGKIHSYAQDTRTVYPEEGNCWDRDNAFLSQAFEYRSCQEFRDIRDAESPFKTSIVYDLDFWTLEEKFQERVCYYDKVIKYFKHNLG